MPSRPYSSVFFFNDTATTEIYTLSLHDALPILVIRARQRPGRRGLRHALQRRAVRSRVRIGERPPGQQLLEDRKSTRLNSSHSQISYAVFCLKKKKELTSR